MKHQYSKHDSLITSVSIINDPPVISIIRMNAATHQSIKLHFLEHLEISANEKHLG